MQPITATITHGHGTTIDHDARRSRPSARRHDRRRHGAPAHRRAGTPRRHRCAARAAAADVARLAGLPVGGFSYSEGLEAAVDAGLVTRRSRAPRDWLLDQLHLGLGAQRPAGRRAGARRLARGDDRDTRRRARTPGSRTTRETERAAPADRADGPLARALAAPSRRRRRAPRALEALAPAPTWPIAFALAARRQRRAAARRRCSPSPSAGPRTWCRRRSRRCRSARARGQRILAALAAEIPAAVDHALAPRRRRAPGLHADAGDPLGAARDAVLAPVPLLSAIATPIAMPTT